MECLDSHLVVDLLIPPFFLISPLSLMGLMLGVFVLQLA
jgi:hypothetical protein